MTEAVKMAHGKIRPAKVLFDRGPVDNSTVPGCPMPNCASRNRSPTSYLHNPPEERAKYDSDVERYMTLLKILDAKTKQPMGVLNWFSVHATSMKSFSGLISGDNKGYAQYAFERAARRVAFSGLEAINGPSEVSPAGQGPFVAAFATGAAGDVSPNVHGSWCEETGVSCETAQSAPRSARFATPTSSAHPPGGRDILRSTRVIGERQYLAARHIFDGAKRSVGHGVDYRTRYVDLTHYGFRYEDGTPGRTCPPAMGTSFAAGTTDGPSNVDDFGQNMTPTNGFLRFMGHLLTLPPEEAKRCHWPKDILLYTGSMKAPYDYMPSKMAFQLLRIGDLVIAGVPGEFTTMAGRRTAEVIKKAFVNKGVLSPEGRVVVNNVASGYAGYVATFEEYQHQRYEGASTAYGPHTHGAMTNILREMAEEMAEGKVYRWPGAVPRIPTEQQLWEGQSDVVADDPPIGGKFGDVKSDVWPMVHAGGMAQATIWGAHPRNNLRRNSSFVSVWRLKEDGRTWLRVADDNDWELRFEWKRVGISASTVTITWDVPEDCAEGSYSLYYSGEAKHLGRITTISGRLLERRSSSVAVAELEIAGLTEGRFPGSFRPAPKPGFLQRRLEVWDRLWEKAQADLAERPKKPIQVTLPDGSVREATSWSTTPLEIAEGISKGLANSSVVALVEYLEPVDASCAPCVAADGEEDEEDSESVAQLWDLTRPLEGSCKLELIKFDDDRGRETFWHSSSHVLGAALEASFGGHLTIGPAVEGGFYYDMFLGEQRLSETNFPEIEKSVEELRKSPEPIAALLQTGAKKVATDPDAQCHCLTPNTGTSGHNAISCDDGTTPYCAWYMACVTTDNFTFSETDEVACKPLFRNSPFLMTHDSGTGFMGTHDIHSSSCKTQTLNFVEQLNCGVRAFDIRSKVWYEDWTQIHFTHGPWVSDQTVASAMPDVVTWAQSHPDEMVVVVISHCEVCKHKNECKSESSNPDASCTYSQFKSAYEAVGMKVQFDCSTLNTWTLDEARDFAQMDGGGRALVIPGEGYCVNSGYDSSVTSESAVWPYLQQREADAHSITTPYQTQAFIQQKGAIVPRSASVNLGVASRAGQYPGGDFEGVNFLEINLACAYGPTIAQSLGATVSSDDYSQCQSACSYACSRYDACEQ
ncbi:unnamed protein product [Effrenium voratum]|uniref:Threonyl-tRNA synthetase n=1 Tax=Effrenium voratum TaxID=2562239 RepID=A0AA36NJE7_9DINO|nr:unnamed protein product [Effrenium voratum]